MPPLKPNHTVLDVGSRLGAVLYGAYLFSEAGKLLGIEVNKELCDLQNHVIQTFGFSDRASVIHAEMTTRPDLFVLADVIILNNVFEWFVDNESHNLMWKFLYNNIKVGALLVTMPSLEKSTDGLSLGISLKEWVKPFHHINGDTTNTAFKDIMDEVYLYEVIGNPVPLNENQIDMM